MAYLELANVWLALDSPVASDIDSDWCRSENYYSVFRALGGALTPGSILEIGARVGHSLIALAIDNPRLRRMRWVDNESYVANSNAMAEANLVGFYRRFRPDWQLPAIEYSTSHPESETLKDGYELCHIDGDHSYEGKIKDLEYCAGLRPTWIIADDYDYHPQVGQAIRDFCRREGLPLFIVSSYRGLALMPLHPPIVDWTLGQLEGAGLQVRPISGV